MTSFTDVIKLRHLKYVIKMTSQIFFIFKLSRPKQNPGYASGNDACLSSK